MGTPKTSSLAPDFHDWEITGVAIDRINNTASIHLSFFEDEGARVLCIKGLKRFFLSGMLMQNVILDILAFEESSDSDYFNYCCKVLGIKPLDFGKNVKGKIIYIEPSVGAEIACLCSDFFVSN